VFHFNKGHLKDPTIPMWVVKAKGESYYVDHVDCELPWSTKETPNNASTKGSIKVKRCLITIKDDNCANITELTKEDEQRLSGQKKTFRVITSFGSQLKNFLKGQKHGRIHFEGGGCGTAWFITELYSERVLLLAQLAVRDLRVLMPNETYYKWYDVADEEELYDLEGLEDLYDN
jgi:hypothetical protein